VAWSFTWSSAGLYKVVSKGREVGVEDNTGDSFKKKFFLKDRNSIFTSICNCLWPPFFKQ